MNMKKNLDKKEAGDQAENPHSQVRQKQNKTLQ
jgi:hypothetical protein